MIYGRRFFNIPNFSLVLWLGFAYWWVFASQHTQNRKSSNVKYLWIFAVAINIYTLSRGTVYFELTDENLFCRNYLQPWATKVFALRDIEGMSLDKVAGTRGRQLTVKLVDIDTKQFLTSGIMFKADWDLLLADLETKGFAINEGE